MTDAEAYAAATVEWGTADAANVVTSTNGIFESKG